MVLVDTLVAGRVDEILRNLLIVFRAVDLIEAFRYILMLERHAAQLSVCALLAGAIGVPVETGHDAQC